MTDTHMDRLRSAYAKAVAEDPKGPVAMALRVLALAADNAPIDAATITAGVVTLDGMAEECEAEEAVVAIFRAMLRREVDRIATEG